MDLELSFRDPIEELLEMLPQQCGRVNMVKEGRISDLDAPREFHQVECARAPKYGTKPTESSRPTQNIERTLECGRTRAVVHHVDTFTVRQAKRLVHKAAFRIDDDMIDPGGLGYRHLFFRRNTADNLAAAKLDDLRKQETNTPAAAWMNATSPGCTG